MLQIGRTISLCLLVLLLVLLPSSLSTRHPAAGETVTPSPARPNVILLLIDDAGYDDFPSSASLSSSSSSSSSPHRLLSLPHIASVARAGASFLHTYVTAPQCSPSRAAILTGV